MPIGTPPLPDPVKNNMDDRRVPRPIGGERSHRKAPGTGPGNIGPVGDFSKLWGLNSAISGKFPDCLLAMCQPVGYVGRM